MYRYYDELLTLLSQDYNCSREDFASDKNLVTLSVQNTKARAFDEERRFFSMVTLGKNAVISADERLHGFLTEYAQKNQGHWIFELKSLIPINEELKKYGYTLTKTHHCQLPCKDVDITADYEVKWFYDREIDVFYGDKRFSHAICPKFIPERPDRIVVCAYENGDIIGMAGCSEDAKGWQQIGIDVLPAHRSKGVGKYLVSLIRKRIEELGDIPFYGSAVANYHSMNIAYACGFRPAWVEIGSVKI
ncbi:MAG: GNAT family N-acetyltransferase [Ruminococcus sp.]|nr:GNAT family N-acetyltransferase [Ruminococcus sp.]